MQRYKADRGVTCILQWPPSSLDFYVIENVWRILKQRLAQRGVFINLESLEAALQEKWDRLSQDEIQNLIITLLWRMEEAIERNGLATRF